MNCIKCAQAIEDDSLYCRFCGKKQKKESSPRKRGNGQGTVIKVGNSYRATITLGYTLDENGKAHRQTRSKSFKKKSDAVNYLPKLADAPVVQKRTVMTFEQLYNKWLPTHRASRSTMDCYKAAFKYFDYVRLMPIADIDIDDLQECIDNCPQGKRTQQNMKALCGLLYKFAIPRNVLPNNLNLAQYLVLERTQDKHRVSFTQEQINAIKGQIGTVFGAEYVYCLIYLGFRPSEFLALTNQSVDLAKCTIIGGAKTQAGTDRIVTISPKILPYITEFKKSHENALICDANNRAYNLKDFTEEVFYPVLDGAEIDNPIEDGRHKYTPHTCRHTFSTLMKNIDAPDKDKLELIGHTSTEMLRYYQDINVEDLKSITDRI